MWCCCVLVQIDVKEARKMVESHPQWDFQDDDDDDHDKRDEDADSESNVSSDDEMSDDY